MNSRQKGKRGELAFSKLCREHGYDTRRGQQYNGADGSADVIGLDGVHIEVKWVERLDLRGAMAQSIADTEPWNYPIVAHKKNNCDWLITMRAADWFALYREWESGRQARKE